MFRYRAAGSIHMRRASLPGRFKSPLAEQKMILDENLYPN